MDLDYEKDVLTLLKLLAYRFKSFEYTFPLLRNVKVTDEPWVELYVSKEGLEDVGLTLYKAEKLFPAVCRKQGLDPQDFLIDDVVEDENGVPDLASVIKKSKDKDAIYIPVVLQIENVLRGIENNTTQTKNSEFIVKEFDPKNKLTFNGLDGEFVYNKIRGRLSVKKRPYKILRTLLKGKDNSATYQELVSVMLPNKEYRKLDNGLITDALQTLKENLGILPKTENSNPDCFKNIVQVGYRLELTE